MSVSQSEAEIEYSTSRRGQNGARGGLGRPPLTSLGLGVIGALLLATAEFTPLLKVRTIAAHPHLVRTIQTGPHHGWAELVIAVLAVVLVVAAARSDSRVPLLALGLAGGAALAIALLIDLPSVHSHGLVGSPASGLRTAQAHAALGLYLETLGAVCLLVGAGAGSLLRTRRRKEKTRELPTARDRGLRQDNSRV